MRPLLIDLGTVDLPLLGPTHLFLPTYGVLFALGVTLAWIWFGRRTRALGLADDRRQVLYPAIAPELQGDRVALFVLADRPLQAARRGDRLGIDGGDDVTDPNPGPEGPRVIDHIRDHHTGVFGDAEVTAQFGSQLSRPDAEEAARTHLMEAEGMIAAIG